jgi:16S rRNA (cytidine1402-2'-O)-methyltransferase
MFYIVATPIGNLKDITLRAIEVLRSVDLIACEDTRHSKILLQAHGITTPMTSYFQHNRVQKGEYILSLLKEGKSVALISDAGMPGILDPGYQIINAAIAQGIAVTVIPGPTACIQALVASGKPAHSFVFDGFLPVRSQARINHLQALRAIDKTIVLYESPHRIIAALRDIQTVFGDKHICVARELTKKFEEILRGTSEEIAVQLEQKKPRGEFVIVI